MHSQSPRKPIRRRVRRAKRSAVPREYEQLCRLRLDRDWSWNYLEQLMSLEGCRLSARSLTYMRTKDGRLLRPFAPYDRTLFKIRKFLKLYRSHRRRLAADRRSAA